jgi:uncharacterized protein (DUF924 family)
MNEVLTFWFEEIESKKWFAKDLAFDQEIKERFHATHTKAIQGELFIWRETAKGRLAEIIVLDQFSRNMYRDTPQAFMYDTIALILSQEAINLKLDQELSTQERSFLYMPFMHSESLLIHEKAVELFSLPGLEFNLEFEHKHKVIIEKFGRYPHRNEILGRASTAEELEFLKGANSSF